MIISQFVQNIIENLTTLAAHKNLSNLTIVQRSQAEYLYKSLILFLREENHEAFSLFQKECNFDFSFQEENFNYVDAAKLHRLFFTQPETFNKFLSLIETALEHYIKQNHLQERADILSKINFIHGTTTNIFALGTSLKPTGKLFKQGIVPFSGELYNGISLNGVNMGAISSATVSSHAFIWSTYSQAFIVTAESLSADVQNIFAANQFRHSLAGFTHYLICCQRLKQFDEKKFKEIMGEADNNQLHERNISAINDYCALVTVMLEQLKELLTLPNEQLNQKEEELRFSGKIPTGTPSAQKLKKAGDARDLVAPNGVDCAITTKGIERKHLFRYFAELKEQRPERRFFWLLFIYCRARKTGGYCSRMFADSRHREART